MNLPPLPAWDSLHPIIVHFPIALLLVAPLFVVASWIAGDRPVAKGLALAALGMMVVGTLAAVVAVSTGEAAEDFAKRVAGAKKALDRHEELAKATLAAFAGLTALYAAILAAPAMLKRTPGALLSAALHLLFLGAYAAGAALLSLAAHEGGLLVHRHGVKARVDATINADALVDDFFGYFDDDLSPRGRGGREAETALATATVGRSLDAAEEVARSIEIREERDTPRGRERDRRDGKGRGRGGERR
jgi:uncharacterized membrane protein